MNLLHLLVHIAHLVAEQLVTWAALGLVLATLFSWAFLVWLSHREDR